MPVEGEIKRLSNGAQGEYYRTAKGNLGFRFIKPDPADRDVLLASLAKARSVKRGMKPLSLDLAERLFKKAYSPKNYKRGARDAKAAATRDMCHLAKRTTSTSAYRRSPKRYDYIGLDDGSQCKGKMIVVPASRIAKARAALSARRGKADASDLMNIQLGGGCAWNHNTARCNKVKGPEMHSDCALGGKKADRCVKTKSAPKGIRAMTAMLKGFNM